MRVEVHIFSGGGWSLLAEVDEVSLTACGAQEQKSATAKVARLRMDDGERESGGDGGVDGIAAGLHDFYSDAGGEFVNAGDHGMGRVGGRNRRGEACRKQNEVRADCDMEPSAH